MSHHRDAEAADRQPAGSRRARGCAPERTAGQRPARGRLCLWLLLAHVPCAAAQPRLFQPGVQIDWQQPAVYVGGQVVLREGPLEFLACLPGKEHESIIRLDAAAAHIYLALGLIGLNPGHPPRWDEQRGRFSPPAGDLIDVTIEWDEGGARRTARACDWLREIEYSRTPLERPWVFAGSQRLRDGTLAADHSGACVALVDQPDPLLAPSRSHSSRDVELWVEADTPAIPPSQTPVQLVLRPARPREHAMRVDFRGVLLVDGRFARPEDGADLISLARRLRPDYVQQIALDGTLPADARRLQILLTEAGVPSDAVRFVGAAETAPGR